MIRGRYIIRQGDNILSESTNAITSEGINIIRSYLANPKFNWAGGVSVGSLNSTAAASSNTSMDYEIARIPVILRSIEGSEIVIKAVLDSEFSGKIYELGVYPSVENVTSLGFDDKILVNFDELWYDTSTLLEIDSSNFSSTSRVGQRSLIVTDSAIDTSTDLGVDVSGYSNLDSISILYNVTSTGTDRTLRVTMIDDQLPSPGTKYFDFVIDGSSTGYSKISEDLGNFTETNNFNGDLVSIQISSSEDTGAATINLDSIRINDADETDPNFALVSRSLIGNQNGDTASDYVIKPAGVEVDIEYRLEILTGTP